MTELTVYGRAGCHLCEEMLAGLAALKEEFGLRIREIDVDSDPALAERYGRLVPVLMLGEEEICHYFLDEERLRARLASRP